MRPYVQDYPDPGPLPVRPEVGDKIFDIVSYNQHVLQLRKHNVAKAMDDLILAGDPSADPVRVILIVLGAAFLDGSVQVNTLPGSFGGLL